MSDDINNTPEIDKTEEQERGELRDLHVRMAGGTGSGALPPVGLFRAPSASPSLLASTAPARGGTTAGGFARGGFMRRLGNLHRARMRREREAAAAASSSPAASMAPSVQGNDNGNASGTASLATDGPIESPEFEPWTGVENDVAPSMNQQGNAQSDARVVVTVRDIIANPASAVVESHGARPSARVSRDDVVAVAQAVQGDIAMGIGSSPLSSAVASAPDIVRNSDGGSDYEDSDMEEGEGDGVAVIHLHKDDIHNIKYNDVFDLIKIYVPRGGSVEQYTIDIETRRVRDALTHKYIGDLEDLFPVANEELTKALEFRNENDPAGTLSYRFPKSRNTPGTEGRIKFLWPEAHDIKPVKGEVNLAMLFVVFRDLDNENKVGVKYYPGLQDEFDFDNQEHIVSLNRWRLQIKNRKLGARRYKNNLNYEWTEKEHKYLLYVMGNILGAARSAKEKNVMERLDYRAIEEKMDRHFNGLIQRKNSPLANEACDMPEAPAKGQKKKSVRRKLRSDRKALIHTVEEIKERIEACMSQIEAHKPKAKSLQGGEDWAKFLVPIEKKVPKPMDNTCVCGRDWTGTDMDREKTQKIKNATDRAPSGNKLPQKKDAKGKGRAQSEDTKVEEGHITDYEEDDFDDDEDVFDAAEDSEEDESPRPAKRKRTTGRLSSQVPDSSQAGPGPQTQASRARASRTVSRTPSQSASPSASTRITRSANKPAPRRR